MVDRDLPSCTSEQACTISKENIEHPPLMEWIVSMLKYLTKCREYFVRHSGRKLDYHT